MKNIEKWKTLQSEMAFDNKWCKVRREVVGLPSGLVIDDYFLNIRPDVVLILPVTEEGNAIMVRQYKHGAGEVLLEFPGGVIDPEDASPLAAAERELREETGYSASRLEELTVFYDNPTKDTNKIYCFLARDSRKTHETKFDATEDIETVEIPFDDVAGLIQARKIAVAGSIAIYYASVLAIK
jgi:ADP-ribose pyrophosphatase